MKEMFYNVDNLKKKNTKESIIRSKSLIMNLKDEFKCMVGAYYGVRTMDNYDLKVYVLKDIENYIKDFLKITPIDNYNYEEESEIINKELSIKTKLQDALIILQRINAPMELIFLVKKKLRDIKDEELKSRNS